MCISHERACENEHEHEHERACENPIIQHFQSLHLIRLCTATFLSTI